MSGIRYAEGLKVLPVLKPQDIAATATGTSFVDFDQILWGTFLVQFGNMTSDSSDTVTLTVEVTSDGASSGEVAIAFKYRLSSAVDTDSMGAITAATSDGAAILGATDDNKLVVIDVDPATVQQASGGKTDGRFVRVWIAPTGPITLVNAIFVGELRYPANVSNSST